MSLSGGASKLTPLAAHIVGAAVHRLRDYLGTDVDPRIEIGNASPEFQQRAAGTALRGGSDPRLKRPPTRQIGRANAHHRDASVGSGMVKLFQHETDGRQVAFL